MPRRALTDMTDPHYSVEEAKRRARAVRAKNVKRLRREGAMGEDGEAFGQAFDIDITKRLLTYLKPYLKQTLLGIALLLLYSAVVPVFPYLILLAIDNYIDPVSAPFTALSVDERFNGLLMIVIIYMSLRLVNFGLRFGYTYLVAWMGQHVIYDLRKEIFTKVQRLHMGFFDRTPVGRLITRITSDVDAIEQMVRDGVIGLVADIGLLVGLLIYCSSSTGSSRSSPSPSCRSFTSR
jgi:ATP-binding cassette subfamily B multidrug efflux pump